MNLRSSNRILVQAAIVLSFFWIVALILLTRPLQNSTSGDQNSDVLQRLSQAASELTKLKERNQELQWILTNISLETHPGKVKDNIKEKLRLTLEESLGSGGGRRGPASPSKEYEIKRRFIFRGVQEMWYFVRSELEKLKNNVKDSGATEMKEVISDIVSTGAEHEMILLNNLDELSNMEGRDSWRATEAHALSDLVQKRLHYLQNPSDCSRARKLICNLNKVITESVC